MNILALDCATHTGWATLINGSIESGVQDFSKRRGESNGLMYLRFNAWLVAMPAAFVKLDLIVYEQSHHRGGSATEIGYGLTTRVQEFAIRIGAEYQAVHTGTIKKFATGLGNSGKTEMINAYEKAVGRTPDSDDEADAYWLLRYAMEEYGVKA